MEGLQSSEKEVIQAHVAGPSEYPWGKMKIDPYLTKPRKSIPCDPHMKGKTIKFADDVMGEHPYYLRVQKDFLKAHKKH